MLSLICLFSVGLLDQLQLDSADPWFLLRVVLSALGLIIAARLMYLTEKLWHSNGDSDEKKQEQASANHQLDSDSSQVNAEFNKKLSDEKKQEQASANDQLDSDSPQVNAESNNKLSDEKKQEQASANHQLDSDSPQVNAESNNKLIEELGNWQPLSESEWNMAEVWLATREEAPHKVVVKFPHYRSLNPDNVTYRFKIERELHGKVDHPNIVPCVATGKCVHPRSREETLCLVQEYIEGYTIKQLLDKRRASSGGQKALPVENIRDIAEQIRSAIYYLHAKNIVHRDLSWHNVMINKSGEVKIIDLGASTYIGSNRTKEMNLPTFETPLFSPPTDICSPVAPKKDFYALAILIYLMLGGKVTKTNKAKEARDDVLKYSKGLKGISEDAKDALRAYLTKNKAHDGDFKRDFDQLMNLLLPKRPRRSSLAEMMGDVTESSSLNI